MQTQNETVVTPGGEDTVHCSFYCKFLPPFHGNLDLITQAKRIAEYPSDKEDAPDPVFECKENLYVVMPYGFAPNKGMSRYCYYQYVLKDGGITIGIQPRECGRTYGEEDDQKDNNRPNVRVEIGALPLIQAGSLENLMPEIEQRLKDMGLLIMKNRLARVDLCVDVPLAVRSLQIAILDRRFITRARTMDVYVDADDSAWNEASIMLPEFDDDQGRISLHFKGYNCTGFTVGKDKIMCRGYDKLAKEKFSEEMLCALTERRCGGELWASMTRIEFQLRRDALRGMAVLGHKDGIETWQDYCKYKAAIARYLCTEWLIFTEKEFDRSHSDRIKKSMDDWHPDWIKVVSAFKRAFGSSDIKISRVAKSIKREAKAAIAQAIGNDQSAMLKTGIELSPHDPHWKERLALFRYASTFRHLEAKEREEAFWRNWNDKELRQEASVPEDFLDQIVPGASTGACVTHGGPLDAIRRVLAVPVGAFGPAPTVIS